MKIKMFFVMMVIVVSMIGVVLIGCQRTPSTTGEGENGSQVVGFEGGVVDSLGGASVEIPSGVLNQEVVVMVSDTPDTEIRAAIPDGWPYDCAVTIDATITEGGGGDPANEGFYMTVTVPLGLSLPAGTVLNVYRKGEDYGEWALLEVKAIVATDGLTATFDAIEPGTYLLRQHDEYSTPSFNFDELNKTAEKELPAPAQPQLIKVGGSGPIPIILFHGAGSYKDEDTYRWGNFIRWANSNLDLKNRYQLWVFLHDSDSHPVGFDINAIYGGKKNNALEFAEQLQAKRDSGEFPKADETQFIIVAHSRGGLVARAFMKNWPTGGDQVLVAITLATPHHGSCLAVPDWMFDTIEREYWGDFFENQAIMVWGNNFKWDKLGSADLAWDNFDGTSPWFYGIPYRFFDMNINMSGIVTERITVSTNDAGWPTTRSLVKDNTIWLPPEYVLTDNVTPGRRSGTTLWDLNNQPQVEDRYLNKFILYAGYLYDCGGFTAAFTGDEHQKLAYANRVMSNFQSEGQSVSHYASNDGFVALQSALYLNGSGEEPIYATKEWFRRTIVSYPIELDVAKITVRLKLANKTHYRLCHDYDHLDMVAGAGNLFEIIADDLNNTFLSKPTVLIKEPVIINGAQVTLDASGSYDNSTTLWPATSLKYRIDWDINDGLNWSAWSTSTDFVYSYPSIGTYEISLQACDQDGMLSSVATISVTVGISGEGEGEGEPGQTETIMLPGDVPLEMVWIPAGTFMMGSPDTEQDRDSNEGPQHQVTLSHGFWLGKYELTKAQWIAVMGTKPWVDDGQWFGNYINDPNSPAVYIKRDYTKMFINALNMYTKFTFRLPFEAEWEYACRAGTTTRFYWGDDPNYTEIGDYAWYSNNTDDVDQSYSHIVGLKLPNAWGLYDMSGNAREWCQDGYSDYTPGAVTDPKGSSSSSISVGRGGGWSGDGSICRSSYRYTYGIFTDPFIYNQLGFRLAR